MRGGVFGSSSRKASSASFVRPISASDNGIGVVGVAPKVKLWGVKVLQANGQGTDESVMAGIDSCIRLC